VNKIDQFIASPDFRCSQPDLAMPQLWGGGGFSDERATTFLLKFGTLTPASLACETNSTHLFVHLIQFEEWTGGEWHIV